MKTNLFVNIVRKGENPYSSHFNPFPQYLTIGVYLVKGNLHFLLFPSCFAPFQKQILSQIYFVICKN